MEVDEERKEADAHQRVSVSILVMVGLIELARLVAQHLGISEGKAEGA